VNPLLLLEPTTRKPHLSAENRKKLSLAAKKKWAFRETKHAKEVAK